MIKVKYKNVSFTYSDWCIDSLIWMRLIIWSELDRLYTVCRITQKETWFG